MNQVTLNILIQVGVGTILAAVVKFYFDRKFEQFRSELQKAAAQKNVQYSRVFDEIAHAISETYSKLISLHLALDDYTRPPTDSLKNDTSLDERFKVVVGMYKDFEVCFAPRCLFLPAKTGELIDSFTHTVKNAILEFKRSVELSDWTRSRTGHGHGRLAGLLRGHSASKPRPLRGLKNLPPGRSKACPVLNMMRNTLPPLLQQFITPGFQLRGDSFDACGLFNRPGFNAARLLVVKL